jgi:hypothetical protein
MKQRNNDKLSCGSGKWCKYINQWWFQCEAGGNDGVQTELYKQCGGLFIKLINSFYH